MWHNWYNAWRGVGQHLPAPPENPSPDANAWRRSDGQRRQSIGIPYEYSWPPGFDKRYSTIPAGNAYNHRIPAQTRAQ